MNRIFLAGHNGMVGSAILRAFTNAGLESSIITAKKSDLDLLNSSKVLRFLQEKRPNTVIIAAARVGGINANISRPADFLYENLQIQNNLIHGSHLSEVEKVIFLSSSCIYPKNSPQPIKEEFLLTGPLEPTNEGYALSKITGMKMLEYYHKQHSLRYLTLIPCNLYGPNDSFDLEHSHVLSALVKRFVDATNHKQNEIMLWGSGVAKREFLHVDDVAQATLSFFTNGPDNVSINIGAGKDISIKELAEKIGEKVGYRGQIIWDRSKPDGMLRKCLDVSEMRRHGFIPKISLESGIEQMIRIYKEQMN